MNDSNERVDIAVLRRDVDELKARLENLTTNVNVMQSSYDKMVARSGGIAAALIGLGGILGWAASLIYYLKGVLQR